MWLVDVIGSEVKCCSPCFVITLEICSFEESFTWIETEWSKEMADKIKLGWETADLSFCSWLCHWPSVQSCTSPIHSASFLQYFVQYLGRGCLLPCVCTAPSALILSSHKDRKMEDESSRLETGAPGRGVQITQHKPNPLGFAKWGVQLDYRKRCRGIIFPILQIHVERKRQSVRHRPVCTFFWKSVGCLLHWRQFNKRSIVCERHRLIYPNHYVS